MLVTVSGLPGVGTTTVGRALAQRLELPYRSSGDIFREQAQAAGMSLADYGARAQQDAAIDKELDRLTLEEARKGNLVLEGRLTGWLTKRNEVPAYRVWLSAPLEVRLDRIANREGGVAPGLKERVTKREASERDRYLRYYDIDLLDTSPYDMDLDTSDNTPDELEELIVSEMTLRLEQILEEAEAAQ